MWSLISKDRNFSGIVHYIVLDEVSLVSDLIPSLVGEYICPTVNETRVQWSNISEAKFITGIQATKEAMLIQHLTNAPFHEPSLPHAELRGDNQGTLALACILSENQTYRYDEFSRFTYTYCLAAKDDLRNCLKDHIALVERSTGDRVKAFPLIMSQFFFRVVFRNGFAPVVSPIHYPDVFTRNERHCRKCHYTHLFSCVCHANVSSVIWLMLELLLYAMLCPYYRNAS